MYTAVRMVKMNACRKPTRTSKPVRRDEQRERNGSDDDRDARGPQRRAAARERHQDEVAGEHVGEESDGQRERPHEELRDELDRRDEEQERLRHAGRDQVEFLR